MPGFVGFQSLEVLVPCDITFDVVGVFGLAFHLLFKSCSTYCDGGGKGDVHILCRLRGKGSKIANFTSQKDD